MNDKLIYLIGMMGSGKSTIGRILAQERNYHFIDTDDLIEKVAGKIENVAGRPIREILAHKGEEYFRDLETRVVKEVLINYRFDDTDNLIEQNTRKSIPEIFAHEGEEYFRNLETQVLKEVSTYQSSAIATGGGIILEESNWSYLRQGLIVWLDVDVEILRERISRDENRPLADDLEPLFTKRYPLYSALAKLQIECDNEQTPEQVANRIMEQIPGMIMNKR